MAQKIRLTNTGLDILEIGASIDKITKINFDRIATNPHIRNDFSKSKDDSFQYFYIKEDSVSIENIGALKNIFFACNKQKIIKGIFLIFDFASDSIKLEIDRIFNPSVLQSVSSIGGISTGNKFFWNKKDVNVIYIRYSDTNQSIIKIYEANSDSKTPDLFLPAIYK